MRHGRHSPRETVMTFNLFDEINKANEAYCQRMADNEAKVAAMSEVLRAARNDPDFAQAMALLETKAYFADKRILK